MRRTKATLIHQRIKNLRDIQLLGRTKLESTVRHLGIEVVDALKIAEQSGVERLQSGAARGCQRMAHSGRKRTAVISRFAAFPAATTIVTWRNHDETRLIVPMDPGRVVPSRNTIVEARKYAISQARSHRAPLYPLGTRRGRSVGIFNRETLHKSTLKF